MTLLEVLGRRSSFLPDPNKQGLCFSYPLSLLSLRLGGFGAGAIWECLSLLKLLIVIGMVGMVGGQQPYSPATKPKLLRRSSDAMKLSTSRGALSMDEWLE